MIRDARVKAIFDKAYKANLSHYEGLVLGVAVKALHEGDEAQAVCGLKFIDMFQVEADTLHRTLVTEQYRRERTGSPSRYDPDYDPGDQDAPRY